MKNQLPQFWSFNRIKNATMIKTEDLKWRGPFSWVGYEIFNKLEPIPDIAGVYLFTFEYKNGYILRSLGVTNSMKRRLREHTREYKKGGYTVLDVELAKRGLRLELWHGWQYAKENQDQFLANKSVILEFVKIELIAYRLFVSEIADKRKRERIEASILINAYSSRKPWSDLIDGGMALRGRYNYETPIKINNVCSHKLYGLPRIIEI